MRKIFFAAAATATLFTACNAQAQVEGGFSHKVDLKAFVPVICSLTGVPSSTLTGGATLTGVSNGSSTVQISVSAAGAVPAQTASLTFANGFCNGNNTRLTLSRNGLKSKSYHDENGFRSEIQYGVNVSWGGGDPKITVPKDDLDSAGKDVGPVSGQFVINIIVDADQGPFVADDYTDSLTVGVAATL